jgi:hypothetical protein
MTTTTFVRKAIVYSRGACSLRPDRAAASDVRVTTVRPATSANAASRCPSRSPVPVARADGREHHPAPGLKTISTRIAITSAKLA